VISGNGGIVQRSGGTTILNGANTYSGGTIPTTGSIGLGSDTIGNVTSGPLGTGPLFLAPELPNVTGKGTVFASGGARTIANPIQYPSATNNQTLSIGGTNNLTFTGPFTLNGNDGTGSQNNRTIEVVNTGLTIISGVISDGGAGFGLTKTGAGTLALNNTETYTGTTTVSDGVLLINGQIGAGAVTVSGGTISGSGTIAGAVDIQDGGTIAPGNQGIGTLTLNAGLTLQSGGTVSVEVNKTTGTHDVLTVNSVTYDGTLLATNISGALSQGDRFSIINAASHSGNFSAVAGSPGAGLAWAFDPATGILSVVAGVNPNPTNITVIVSGNTLNLSWPADHLGWILQSNSVSLTAPDSWFDVSGSATGTNATINIDASKANVFYRLILPQ
jgi:autotransporter-associated beta strand protein